MMMSQGYGNTSTSWKLHLRALRMYRLWSRTSAYCRHEVYYEGKIEMPNILRVRIMRILEQKDAVKSLKQLFTASNFLRLLVRKLLGQTPFVHQRECHSKLTITNDGHHPRRHHHHPRSWDTQVISLLNSVMSMLPRKHSPCVHSRSNSLLVLHTHLPSLLKTRKIPDSLFFHTVSFSLCFLQKKRRRTFVRWDIIERVYPEIETSSETHTMGL